MAVDYSLHWRVREAVHEECQKLDLLDIPPEQVYRRKLPVDRQDIKLPCVIVSKFGTETLAYYSNERDEVGYPVYVTILRAVNQSNEDDDLTDKIRQQIRRRFNEKRLRLNNTPPREIYICRVEAGPVIDPSIWHEQNLEASFLTIRCFSREPREYD